MQLLDTKTPTLRLPLQQHLQPSTARPRRWATDRWLVHNNLLQAMEPSLLIQPPAPSCLLLELLLAQCPLRLACPPQLACLLPLACPHLLACPLLLVLVCLLQGNLSRLLVPLVAILDPLHLVLPPLLVVILAPQVVMGPLLVVLVAPREEEVFAVVVVEEEGE